MAEGKSAPKRGVKGLLACALVAAIAIVGVFVVGGVAIWLFTRTIKPPNQSFITIISSPTAGAFPLLGETINLEASSAYDGGVTRLEVYADGALIAAQDTTLKGGSNPLILSESWTPNTAGEHVLMARARALDGSQSDSSVVFFNVSEQVAMASVNVDELLTPDGNTPTLKAISARTGVSLGDLLAANPDLEGTDPEISLPPGTTLHIPHPPVSSLPPGGPAPHAPRPGGTGPSGTGPGGSIPRGPGSPPRPTPPAPPEALTVTMTCTEATLNWRNTSGSDVNYFVYRIVPGSSSSVPIAGPLPASANSYVDRLTAFGTYYYYIGARRGTEESFTRPVEAHTDASCLPPRPPGSTDLVLTLAAIETDNSFDGIHCYAVIYTDNPAWHRIPAGDFSSLTPSMGRIYNTSSLPSRGRYVMSFQNPSQPVEFRLECFGRNPPRADHIGRTFVSHPPADWNGMVRTATSTAGENGNYRLYYCLGPAATPCNVPGSPSSPAPLWLTDPFLPPPTNVHLDRSFDICMDIPTERERGMCALVGAFTGGYASVLWDWNGNPYYRDSDLTGYHVVLRSITRRTGITSVVGEWDVLRRLDGNLGRVIADRANRNVCGVTYRYYVSAVTAERRSVESAGVEIVTPDCFDPVEITVDFQSFYVDDFVDDWGDFDTAARDTDVESFGYMSLDVGSNGRRRWLTPPQNSDQGTNYTLAGMFGGVTSVTLPVTSASQTVTILFHLRDADDLYNSYNDPDYCSIRFELHGRPSAEWASYRETLLGNFQDNLEAGCTTSFLVTGRLRP